MSNIDLAVLYFRNKNFVLAKKILIDLIKNDQISSKSYELLAYIYGNEGDDTNLFKFLKLSTTFSDASADVHFYYGKYLNNNGDIDNGIKHIFTALNLGGLFFEGLFELGMAYVNLNKFNEAVYYFNKSVEYYPNNCDSIFNLAKIYGEELNDYSLSIEFYEKLILLEHNSFRAIMGKAFVYFKQENYSQAIALYESLLEFNPESTIVLNSLGDSYLAINDFDKAMLFYESSLFINADPIIFAKKAFILFKINKLDNSIKCYDEALSIKNIFPEALAGKAQVLFKLGLHSEAFQLVGNAITQNYNFAYGWKIKGDFHLERKDFFNAVKAYEICFDLDNSQLGLLNSLIYSKIHSLNWNNLDQLFELVKFRSNKNFVIEPFTALSLSDDIDYIQLFSKSKINSLYNNLNSPFTVSRISKPKIKVAYLSPDFRDHPVSHLLSDVIALHDRNCFEIFGFNVNPDSTDNITNHVSCNFNYFFDVSSLSDLELLSFIRSHNIDILIDLAGFTKNERINIFLNRAAPIQINFLGYPNSLFDCAYDYIIADKYVIPEYDYSKYPEKVISLPNSFQPNSLRKKTETLENFTDHIFPDNVFIFSSFNSIHKITYDIFIAWIKILSSTKDSVLLIYLDNQFRSNFINLVNSFGISSSRIFFTGRVSRSEYLKRFEFADLFLDTFPFGGGTTSSDSLWSGLPILTIAGNSFHSRMAASFLNSLGLSELIVSSTDEYIEKAVFFYENPNYLNLIRQKLALQHKTHPVFDVQLYTRNFDLALKTAYSNFVNGCDASNIIVE